MATPANKKSDVALRDDIKRLVQRLKLILKRNEKLNDALFVLGKSRTEIRQRLRALEAQLKKPIISFFASSEKIDDMVLESHKDFVENLSDFIERGEIKIRNKDTNAIAKQIKRQYQSQFSNVISEMVTRQISKHDRFLTLAEASVAPVTRQLEKEALIRKNAVIVLNRGTKEHPRFVRMSKAAIDQIWQAQGIAAGDVGHILYNDPRSASGFRRYPFVTWAEGRLDTLTQDAHRLTQLIDSAANDIPTVRISRHGATDDCRLSEGELLFINDAAKAVTLRKFPDEGLEKLRTVQQAEADPTHIFSFRCRHIVTPTPLNLMGDDDRASELEKSNEQLKQNKTDFKKVKNANLAA